MQGRDREEDAGTTGEEALGRGGVAGVGLVAHTHVLDALGLGDTGKIGDGDAHHAVHVLDAVGDQGVGEEMHAVGETLIRGGGLVAHVYLQCHMRWQSRFIARGLFPRTASLWRPNPKKADVIHLKSLYYMR